MSDSATLAKPIEIDSSRIHITAAVDSIREHHGIAEAVFSKRPISLCKSIERRNFQRVSLEVPIYLYPVLRIGNRVFGDWKSPVMGVTRDISEHGVGFHYDVAIHSRHVLAEFDLYGAGQVWLLIEFRWHQKKEEYSYVAGGLIVGVAKAGVSGDSAA